MELTKLKSWKNQDNKHIKTLVLGPYSMQTSGETAQLSAIELGAFPLPTNAELTEEPGCWQVKYNMIYM